MIDHETFNFFGNIPVIKMFRLTHINLLGKHLLCGDIFYPSDESHIAFIKTKTNEVFIRNSQGIEFSFPPETEDVVYIVTPDIKRILNRDDLLVPDISCLISEDAFMASAFI